MKKATLLCYLQIGFLFNYGNAQIISGNAFLKGNYIEAGIAKNGTLGSGILPPAGFHPTTSGTATKSLGLVCDREKNGWTVGTPSFYGDFISAGTPLEKWGIQVNGIKVFADRSVSDSFMSVGLKGENVHIIAGPNTQKTLWRGAWNDLYIEQNVTMDTSKKYLLFDIVLQNRGSSTLKNIYYNRAVDVDHEEDPSDAFGSGLKIDFQVPNPQELVGVSATSKTYKSYLGLLTNDCRAKAYYLNAGLSSAVALDSLYSGLGASATNSYLVGDSICNDAGMGLVFKLDSLKVNELKHLHFAYLADKADLSALLVETKKSTLNWTLNRWHNSFDTGYMCEGEARTILINAQGSDNWVWESSPYLSTLTGPTSTFVAPPGTYNLHAMRNNLYSCGGIGLDTINMSIKVLEKPKPVIVRPSKNQLSTTQKYTVASWFRNGLYVGYGDTLTPIINGKYTVVVKDSMGCENSSFAVLIDNAVTISIEETKNVYSDFVVFPNPNKGTMSLKLPNSSNYESSAMVKLIDLLGRVVHQTSVEFHNSLGKLQLKIASGTYMLELQKEDGSTYHQKVLIE